MFRGCVSHSTTSELMSATEYSRLQISADTGAFNHIAIVAMYYIIYRGYKLQEEIVVTIGEKRKFLSTLFYIHTVTVKPGHPYVQLCMSQCTLYMVGEAIHADGQV